MGEPTLDEVMDQHLKESLRRWSQQPTAALIHEFAVVRGDLSEPASQEQLARLIDLKVADAERAGGVRALRNHGDDLGGLGDTAPSERDAYAADRAWQRADAIENGADYA